MKKLIITISLIYTLFISLAGIGVSMHMHDMDYMNECVYMQEDSSVCPMSSTSYVSELRNMFSGVVKSEAIIILLALSLAVFLALPLREASLRSQIKYKFFENFNFVLKFSDHIFRELYKGILNPKSH